MASSHRVRIGHVEILSISDSSFAAEPRFLFPEAPKADLDRYRHLYDLGDRFTVNVGCFVVWSSGKTIVVDTGIGPERQGFVPAGRLPDVLQEEGVALASVDLVVLTHLHMDHVGWNTARQGDRYVPTFPKARYLTTRQEWHYWTSPEIAAQTPYVETALRPVEAAGVLDLVDLNSEHAVTDELRLIATPGHTPGHISIGVASAGEFGVILGDVAHHPAQVSETGWKDVFDTNPALAIENREKLFARIERERMLVAAGHFRPPNFGRVVRVEGRRTWQAL